MRVALILSVALVTAQMAGAQLTADQFRAAVQKKVAPPVGTIETGKWKALCVCNSTERIGAIESFLGIPELGAQCTVPFFEPGGLYAFGAACYDWTPLTK